MSAVSFILLNKKSLKQSPNKTLSQNRLHHTCRLPPHVDFVSHLFNPNPHVRHCTKSLNQTIYHCLFLPPFDLKAVAAPLNSYHRPLPLSLPKVDASFSLLLKRFVLTLFLEYLYGTRGRNLVNPSISLYKTMCNLVHHNLINLYFACTSY